MEESEVGYIPPTNGATVAAFLRHTNTHSRGEGVSAPKRSPIGLLLGLQDGVHVGVREKLRDGNMAGQCRVWGGLIFWLSIFCGNIQCGFPLLSTAHVAGRWTLLYGFPPSSLARPQQPLYPRCSVAPLRLRCRKCTSKCRVFLHQSWGMYGFGSVPPSLPGCPKSLTLSSFSRGHQKCPFPQNSHPVPLSFPVAPETSPPSP